jgi:hypothetical protein
MTANGLVCIKCKTTKTSKWFGDDEQNMVLPNLVEA